MRVNHIVADSWKIVENSFHADYVESAESIFSLGNGGRAAQLNTPVVIKPTTISRVETHHTSHCAISILNESSKLVKVACARSKHKPRLCHNK
mgnify:CR=1 FL=1